MREPLDRIWEKTVVEDRGHADECHVFTGALNRGYGRIEIDGKGRYVHVIVYEHEVGPVPDGKELDHLCRVEACHRSSHVEPVTHRVNLLRGNGACARNARKTHCKHGHEFTPENTYVRPSGHFRRECRTCRSAAMVA